MSEESSLTKLPLIVQQALAEASKEPLDKDSIAELAQDYLKSTDNLSWQAKLLKSAARKEIDVNGLTSLLLLTLFAPDLTPDINQKLYQNMEKGRTQKSLTEEVLDKTAFLTQVTQEYFTIQAQPFDHVKAAPIKDPLATLIINLKEQQIVSELKNRPDFKDNPNWVIELFTDPKSSQTGIWMSTQGLHFDPTKL